MRYATPLMIAVAFAFAAPAAAQDTNAADNAAVAANELAPADANVMAVDPALANDVAMAPAPTATDPAMAPETAPADDGDGGGFPWGLLGLLGLIGLIPRSRN